MSLVRVQHRPLLLSVIPCPSGVYVFVGMALDVDALHFERGQQLRDWAEDAKTELNPEEVQQ